MSGQPFLFFIGPFPHRDSRFYFSFALSRFGIAVFIFRSHFPALGRPFLFFVGTFPHRVNDFQSQNYEK